jgi:hypothetical protein
MSNRSILTVALSCILAAGLSSTATAKPVTAKDVVGKKICWNTPNAPFGTPAGCVNDVTTYYHHGKFHSTCWGNGSCKGDNCDSETGKFYGTC